MEFVKTAIHLSYDEYYALMCLLGAEKIYGTFITEEYENMSSEKFENLWEACKKSLSEKEYITISYDNLVFNMAVYFLLSECINCNNPFTIQLSHEGTILIDDTYYNKSDALICVKNDAENKELSIFIQPSEVTCEKVISYLDFVEANESDRPDEYISLTQQQYLSLVANINIDNKGKIADIVKDMALSEETIWELTGAINKSNISLSIATDDGNTMYGFISSKKTIWAVTLEETEHIVFRKVKRDDIKEAIRTLFS